MDYLFSLFVQFDFTIYLNFIKQIEDFYKKAGERILPEDEIDREGYLAFWKEWRDLKEKSAWI